MKYKKGQKLKFPVPGTGRNHFGTFVEKDGADIVVNCPALAHFEGDELMVVSAKTVQIYQDYDRMEEAGEEINYLLRCYNDKGINPRAREKLKQVCNLLGVKTDDQRDWDKEREEYEKQQQK